jgi:mRNA interferase RelE/StbE
VSSYRVELTKAAAKELRKLDVGVRRRVLAGIAELEEDPRPPGCKKLVGESNAWRIRIGDYRVLYDVIDDVLIVTVVRVAHRREVYK